MTTIMPAPATARPGRARSWLRRAARRRVAVVSFIILAGLLLAAISAPWIAPYSPTKNDLASIFQLPSSKHLLGTDQLGRDLLSRLLWGGRVSLLGVAEAVGVYFVIGLTTGIVAGYVGGLIDSFVVWLAEVSFSLPQIIVVLSVLAIFANNSHAAMLALGLLGAPGLAVFVRNATRTVRAEPYIAAARVSGLRTRQILARHVLPRVTGPVVVQVTLFAGTALIFQTGLDFLGLASQPPNPTWGGMVADGAIHLGRDAWMAMPAGIVIVLVVLALNLLGDALQGLRADRMSAVNVIGTSNPVALMPAGHTLGERDLVPSPDAILSVRALDVTTTTTPAAPIVRGASFDLAPGTCVGIVGESGCGKTMTALAIIGLLPSGVVADGGSIVFDGVDLRGGSENRYRDVRGSGIAMISQEPIASLDPSFTVRHQLVEVIRRHSRMSRRLARAEAIDLLGQVRLPDPESVARRYPHQLSGGMAQRVMIAIALAGNPKVLIADEPTTALDVTVQADILELLRTLRRERGLAMILVSHDWGVIADSCDSALVMYAGQVVEEAPIEFLFGGPKHPYSYALMKSNPHGAVEPRALLPAVRGSVPPVGQWPAGCHFQSRCDFATDACSAPISLEQVDAVHWARCIHTSAVPTPSGRPVSDHA